LSRVHGLAQATLLERDVQDGLSCWSDNSKLEFLADVVIDRPSPPSPKEDGETESCPQQRVLVTSIGPEEPVRSLENNHDDHHLDKYHRGGNAREQADRQACSGDEFAEKCQISQRERQRQTLVADGNRKPVR
jgi:hypothetical protein